MLPAHASEPYRRNLVEPVFTAAVVALLIVSGVSTLQNILRLRRDTQGVEQNYKVLATLNEIESAMREAESGQRGFISTGHDIYLEPYAFASQKVDDLIVRLEQDTRESPRQQSKLGPLKEMIQEKRKELQATIELRKNEGFDAAQAALVENLEKRSLDRVRDQLQEMRHFEQSQMKTREYAASHTYRFGLITALISSAAGLVLMGSVVYLLRRDRQRAELAAVTIHHQRERLQVTLESIGDGLISTDRNGNVTYLNKVAQLLTGWDDGEVRGRPLAKVFPIVLQEARHPETCPAAAVLRSGGIVELPDQTLLVSKLGQEIPIDGRAAPTRDAQGRLDGVVLVFRDVTQRRHQERLQRESAAFTRSILDALSESVVVLDPDTRVITVNEAFLNMFQLTEADSLARCVDELVGDCCGVTNIQTLVADAVKDDARAHHLEIEAELPALGRRIIRLESHRFDAGGDRPGSILLVISDVTDERQLRESNRRMNVQLTLFLEQIQDYAIFTMDADCRATSWNQGVENVLGFTEDEFIGQNIRTLIFTPEAIAEGVVEAEFSLAAKNDRASDDRWMMRKGMIRFWASGITSSIRDEQGNLIGYSKVMRDLTPQKLAQDELAALATKLSEADHRKNEFLATLAHELRNPLAPVKNAVQLMGLLPLDEEVEELRQTMARQVEQLVRLIDDLLDVSRISRGKIVLRKEIVELRLVVDAAVEASTTFIAESGQELTVQSQAHDVFVDADPARLTQVVSNLLNNSAKYSDAGCRIELTIDVEDDWAVIRVRDNGVGIAADRLEDIFQMFSQVDDSLERGSAGLGIGLTLVKTLVELHGGSVTAESEGPGFGSLFTVRVPKVERAERSEPGEAPSSENSAGRSFRVLVVEDMRALGMILARLLEKLGHEVEVVENGTLALERLSHYSPEIVFSDISMPGMTGYELARRLRQRSATAGIYLVAITGYGQDADREKAIQSGFDEHLIKPVDIRSLRSLFARLSADGIPSRSCETGLKSS